MFVNVHRRLQFNFDNESPMTPTDKSPRSWTIFNGETVGVSLIGPDIAYAENVKVIEHSAYLAVKQELDAARAELKELQERDNRMRDCPACGESYTHLGDKLSDINAEILKNHYEKQLADAKAQIKELLPAVKKSADWLIKMANTPDDEATEFNVYLYTEEIRSELFALAQTLNKWREK